MGKRLKRYFFNEFPTSLETLFGKDVSVVLNDGVSFFGKIVKKEGDFLLLEDKVPRKHRIKIDAINEIIIDSEAPY